MATSIPKLNIGYLRNTTMKIISFKHSPEYLELHDRLLKLENPPRFHHGYEFKYGTDLCKIVGQPEWVKSSFDKSYTCTKTYFDLRDGHWTYYVLCKEEIFRLEEDRILINQNKDGF